MKCYDCGTEVKPRAYPEGVCPSCGLTYTLPDSDFGNCPECGNVTSGTDDTECLDCLIDKE